MAVHDRLHLRPLLHDRQVQHDLAGPFLPAALLLAVHIDDAQILGLHEAFADHGRRADHLAVAHAVTDVAVVGGGEAPLIQPLADVANL
jgi:hypothetical protein